MKLPMHNTDVMDSMWEEAKANILEGGDAHDTTKLLQQRQVLDREVKQDQTLQHQQQHRVEYIDRLQKQQEALEQKRQQQQHSQEQLRQQRTGENKKKPTVSFDESYALQVKQEREEGVPLDETQIEGQDDFSFRQQQLQQLQMQKMPILHMPTPITQAPASSSSSPSSPSPSGAAPPPPPLLPSWEETREKIMSSSATPTININIISSGKGGDEEASFHLEKAITSSIAATTKPTISIPQLDEKSSSSSSSSSSSLLLPNSRSSSPEKVRSSSIHSIVRRDLTDGSTSSSSASNSRKNTPIKTRTLSLSMLDQRRVAPKHVSSSSADISILSTKLPGPLHY
tara:strand:- start:1858 stop:2883 length:1026 start_codon:yes stop_codon:yes gene_type:complete